MAYDDELAERIRDVCVDVVSGEDGLREQQMFGGLAFLVAERLEAEAGALSSQ